MLRRSLLAHRDGGRLFAGRRLLVRVERYPLTAAASEPLFGPPALHFENELGLVVAGVGTHLP